VVLAGFFKVFGFDLMQMRFPALLFGFGFMLLAYRMLKNAGITAFFRNLFFLLLLFDPIYLQNIHSGRMDSLALFLAGLGSLQLLNGIRKGKTMPYLFAGICFGLAILSTPRISVNLVGAGLVAFLIFLSNPGWRAWFRLLLIPLLVVALYSVWVFWGFGGYQQAWDYFFGQPKEKLYYDNLAQGYISFKKYIPAFQYPAILLLVSMLGNWLFRRRPVPWIFWLCFFNLLGYYALVRDTGIYSIFSMPWLYMLLVILGDVFLIYPAAQTRMKWAISFLIFLNAGIFGAKNLLVFLSAPSRDDALAYPQFSSLIPKGSRIIGDEAYYYLAIRSGSDFQYLDRGAAGFQRLKYHVETYDFQYLVVREPVSNPVEFNNYRKEIPLQKIGSITSPPPSAGFIRLEELLRVFGLTVPAGYRGTVYKR
jgi:4-amino-4-deoxy-L-arabinose transferase-like glycosyltransferase